LLDNHHDAVFFATQGLTGYELKKKIAHLCSQYTRDLRYSIPYLLLMLLKLLMLLRMQLSQLLLHGCKSVLDGLLQLARLCLNSFVLALDEENEINMVFTV
jgi:hypothetical protein